MKPSFTDQIRSIFRKRDEKFRHKLTIYLVCLVISVIIWFTIKLSDEYDRVIQIPVTFTYTPKNKVLTYASDTVLQVEIVDKGSDLIRMLYFQRVRPLPVNLRYLPLNAERGEYRGIITTGLLVDDIEREYGLLGKIISISPDTIYLQFASGNVKNFN